MTNIKILMNILIHNKYIENTLWLFIEKTIKILSVVVVGVLVARYVGPKNFGLLSYAQSLVALFISFSTLGVTNILSRDLIGSTTDIKERLIAVSFILVIIGNIFSYVLLMLTIELFIADENIKSIIYLISLSIIFQITNVFECIFQSEVRSKYSVIPNVTSMLISIVLKLILIKINAPFKYLIYSFAFESVIIFILAYVFYKKYSVIKFYKKNLSLKLGIVILKNSYSYIYSGILISIYMKIDQIIIKIMMNEGDLGQYAAVVRLSEGCYFIPMIIMTSIYPSIVLVKSKNNEYLKKFNKIYKYFIYTAILMSICVGIFAKIIVDYTFGDAYESSIPVLGIHIWASIFIFIGVVSEKWLLTEGLQKYSAINTFIGVIVNVILNYLLIPVWGLNGVAVATVISYAFSSYFGLILWKQTRPNFWLITYSIIK